MSKNNITNDIIKAFRKGNRELQFERNGGGQWVAMDRPWKNKKKYDRKRDRKIDSNCLFNFFIKKDFRYLEVFSISSNFVLTFLKYLLVPLIVYPLPPFQSLIAFSVS